MSFYAKGSSAASPRVHVLDFIRLVAMLLMIQGHTLDAFVNPGQIDLGTFHWQTWVHLRGLTAPMFLMVSGAATVLGVRHGPDGRLAKGLLWHRVRVALTVIGLGYLMVFPANRIADLRWVSPDVWRNFLKVNILQINGVTLLLLTGLLAWTRNVRRYAVWSLGFGALILLLAPFVAGVDWFQVLPEGLAAYMSFQHGSLFPLFPTSAYMFLGVGLGALLLERPEPLRVRAFRLGCLTAGAACLSVALIADRMPFQVLAPRDAYQGGYAYVAFRMGFALVLFGLLAWAAEAWPRLTAAWAPMGRKSLLVYVGHLVLIFGTPWTLGLATGRFHALTVAEGALFVPVVGGATFGAILLWDWLRARSTRLGTLVHASALIALVFALVW